jgi:hypothetical protein
MKLSRVKGKVKAQLLKHLPNRDDDNKLVANIWFTDLKALGYNPSEISAFKMLELFAKGELSNPESIRRSRQQLQMLHPELRGQNYYQRRAKDEDMKDQLDKFDSDE